MTYAFRVRFIFFRVQRLSFELEIYTHYMIPQRKMNRDCILQIYTVLYKISGSKKKLKLVGPKNSQCVRPSFLTFLPYLPYLRSLFPTMNSSFRLSVANSLGFETFVVESLDDHSQLYAFLVPDNVSQELAYEVRDFLQICFTNAGLSVDSTEFYEEGMYNYNWCGSRYLTMNLGKHLLFNVHYAIPTSLPFPPKPSCDPWVVVSVAYNSVKPDKFMCRYDTTEMAATTPENYMTTHNALKHKVDNFISKMLH